jgi:hypothetical protein
MNLGSAEFRLGSRSNFTFLNLDDRTAQVQISVGSLNVRLRRLADDETVEIDTPQVAFTLLRPGEYRIDVDEAGDATILTVRGGDGEASANGQAFAVHAREQVRIAGPEGADPIVDRNAAPPADPFDLFCEGRDRREDMSISARYVSHDMPGYADLDANGTWRTDPQYGAVWIPNGVVVGWSPYHYGHWSWIGPWGWTWVDDAPWGYAPFHYGRWAMVGPSWGWIPGPVAARAFYAPAMVAFVGGAGFGAAISIGGGGAAVGWFPLGPRDVWVPSYQVSASYMMSVNVSNTVVAEVNVRNVYTNVYVNHTVVNNVYVNERLPGAVIAVRGDAMTSGRPIGAVAIRVPPAAMVNVTVVHAAAVVPDRAAVLGGRAPLSAHVPPAAVMNRQVVAKVAPPPPPVAFARQQEALKANPGRPLAPSAVRTIQASQPAPRPNFRASGPNAPSAKVAAPAPVRMNPAPVARPEATPARPVAPKPEARPVTPAPRPEARPEARPETARPTPTPRPEARPEVTPARPVAPKPEARPEPKPEARPNPPAERKVEPRAEPKPEPKPERKPTSKPAKKTEKTEKEK